MEEMKETELTPVWMASPCVPSAPGYEKMEVKPVPGYLKSARGQVITPKGMVNVEWYRENKEIHIKLETSEGKVEKEMEVQE